MSDLMNEKDVIDVININITAIDFTGKVRFVSNSVVSKDVIEKDISNNFNLLKTQFDTLLESVLVACKKEGLWKNLNLKVGTK